MWCVRGLGEGRESKTQWGGESFTRSNTRQRHHHPGRTTPPPWLSMILSFTPTIPRRRRYVVARMRGFGVQGGDEGHRARGKKDWTRAKGNQIGRCPDDFITHVDLVDQLIQFSCMVVHVFSCPVILSIFFQTDSHLKFCWRDDGCQLHTSCPKMLSFSWVIWY